jgi:hypothetical protein
MHIIVTRIGCTLLACDMYMCRLRHVHDAVLLSLKMEGIHLLFLRLNNNEVKYFVVFFISTVVPTFTWS